jgi:glycosyltransferase involved in cell wall biosynthesis
MLPGGAPLVIRAYGHDEVRRAIENASAAARRYVRHHRPCFGRELAVEHARIDAVLVPSIWHENSPFVVLEALANGTPVIASNQRGIAPLIDDERTGWLVDPGRADAWTGALMKAIERPALIRFMQMHACYSRTTAQFVDDLERVESRWVTDLPDAATHPLEVTSSL